MTKTYVYEEFLEQRVVETGIRFTFAGVEFVIPPEEKWPDNWPDVLRVGFAPLGEAILGAEQWERFTALGGTGRGLNAFYGHVVRERDGLDVGESDASAASS